MAIYQLKIALKGSIPKVWRTIQVKPDLMFSELHQAIQIAMGWDDEHLYEFTIGKTRIYDFEDRIDDGSNPKERDSGDTSLDELVEKEKTKFTYVYDFGDSWEHTIHVEKILHENEDERYLMTCVAGSCACPPDDSGGILGYQRMLAIMNDKNHPEYEDVSLWLGENWDVNFFDIDCVNASLKDFEAFLEDLYEPEDDEDFEYVNYGELKKFTSPADTLKSDTERQKMLFWFQSQLVTEDSQEIYAFERLSKLGFDEETTKNYLLEALSIEWYYDLKYATGHLEERYAYNLDALPETPQEFPRLTDARLVINQCVKGIPYSAIEYLQNDTSEEATSIIIEELKNHADHQYCWENCRNTPLFYAFAAEGHLFEDLIDVVIELFEENENDSDWLYEQGQYLIGKLAELYPETAVEKLLDAMELAVENGTKPYIFFLFDVFHFAELDTYKTRLLNLLENKHMTWYDTLAATAADLKIMEALPILKNKLKQTKKQPKSQRSIFTDALITELESAIEILEGTQAYDISVYEPLSLAREASWKDEIASHELDFYLENEDYEGFSFLDSLTDQDKDLSIMPELNSTDPFIKEKAPGRNDPCPCGSGKKYKKCCIDKEV